MEYIGFCYESVQAAIQKLRSSFESHMKKGKWLPAISNYKQAYKNLCISSTKCKQTGKGSLCYSKSIYVHFRPNKSMLQELWILFTCVSTLEKLEHMSSMVTWKIACRLHLPPQCHCNMA